MLNQTLYVPLSEHHLSINFRSTEAWRFNVFIFVCLFGKKYSKIPVWLKIVSAVICLIKLDDYAIWSCSVCSAIIICHYMLCLPLYACSEAPQRWSARESCPSIRWGTTSGPERSLHQGCPSTSSKQVWLPTASLPVPTMPYLQSLSVSISHFPPCLPLVIYKFFCPFDSIR